MAALIATQIEIELYKNAHKTETKHYRPTNKGGRGVGDLCEKIRTTFDKIEKQQRRQLLGD